MKTLLEKYKRNLLVSKEKKSCFFLSEQCSSFFMLVTITEMRKIKEQFLILLFLFTDGVEDKHRCPLPPKVNLGQKARYQTLCSYCLSVCPRGSDTVSAQWVLAESEF